MTPSSASSSTVLSPTAKQVGIMGGAFNPLHAGHLRIAQCSLELPYIDQILWIPTGVPPHKELAGGASNQQRLEMVELAIASEANFICSDMELVRTGPSYAFDTLTHLKQLYPHVEIWHWIIGLDAIRDLPSWYRIREVVELCYWLVAPRPSQDNADKTETQKAQLTSTVKTLHQSFPSLQATLLDCEAIAVSSTEIRGRLQHHQAIDSLVPPEIADYIQQNRLYGIMG